MVLYAGAHIFTDRPDLARGMFLHNFERDAIIEYPHAVSCFMPRMGLSYQYFAETLSRSLRKAPTLVSIWGIRDERQPLLSQVLEMHWAVDGKYVYSYEHHCENGEITFLEEAVKGRAGRERLAALFPDLFSLLDSNKGETPELLARMVSNDLGAFVGGEKLERVLKGEGIRKVKINAKTVYQSDRRYQM